MQAGNGLDLSQETLGAEDRRQLRLQHLERYLALVTQVVREVDGSHPALA